MASAILPIMRLSDLSTQNTTLWIGVACQDQALRKTHAITEVIFNDSSYKEATLHFTRDHIIYGWPSHITDPSNPKAIKPSEAHLPMTSIWNATTVSFPNFSSLEGPNLLSDYNKKCSELVETVTLNFDSEKTYENSLLKNIIVFACKTLFPNLRSYSLVFSSL